MVAIPQFDARTVQPASGYEPLPAGWYDVVIVASEMKHTKENTGQYLQFDRKVIAAEHREHVGKTFPERLNLINKSEQAAQIAQRCLSAICHVTNTYVVNDTTQLHNIPHKVRLDVTYGDKQQPIGNDIKAYADMNGNEPGRTGGGAPPVSPQGSHSAQAQPAAPQPVAQPVQAPAAAPAQAWGGNATQPQAQQPAAPAVAAWGAPGGQPQMQAAPAAAPPPAWGAPPPANGAAAPAAWGRPA